MRTNAIIRIVIWSIVIVFLLGILGAGLLISQYTRQTEITEVDIQPTSVPGPVTADDGVTMGSVNAENIRDIEIEWVAGTITIQPSEDTDTIRFSETGNDNEKYQMVYKTSGNKLSIQFCKDSARFPSLGISINESITKDLTITVPAGWICSSLEIDAASANLEVRDMTIGEVEFDGASGTCDFINCTVDSLDVDTASGDIRFVGSLNVLDCDAASASFFGELVNTPSRVDMDGMSGDLELVLPADAGFTVSMDGLSRNFSSEFETVMKNGNHVCGDGRCRINVDGMSGDVTIRKWEVNASDVTEPSR